MLSKASALFTLAFLLAFGSFGDTARAGGQVSANNRIGWVILGAALEAEQNDVYPKQPAPVEAASQRTSGQGTFRINNFDFTLETGEPTFNGTMTKTAWAGFKFPQKQRVVIHTFGSGFNTVLAAYRGTTFANMVRVAGNDNRAVPGASSTESLIQFDTAANTDYRIQLGGRSGAEGLFATNVFIFLPAGGLSAYLLDAGNSVSSRGADYFCSATSSFGCTNPTFIVHNSTAKALIVTATNNLGAGVTNPAAFTLAPGGLKAVTFAFTPAFNLTTPRTISGLFTFTGREGATIVSQASRPGIIVVKASGTLPNLLGATVSPQMRAGFLNVPLAFKLTLTNKSANAAHGCIIHPYDTNLRTAWQRINPATGASIGALNAASGIPAGQSQTFSVYLSKQASVFSYLPPSPLWRIECADTAPLDQNLQTSFDVFGAVHDAPPDILASVLAPTADTLVVPAAGAATRVAAANKGAAGKIEVAAKYEYPFTDAANKRFTVTLCEMASANSACLHPPSASLTYTAAANVTHYFKVFVKRPAANPGFNPTTRRVFLNFRAIVPPQNFGSISVGAESVAPQWH